MQNDPEKSGTSKLALAALGIVYGDIGTSPLYAFKEAFAGAHPLLLTEGNVLAALSALFWSVMPRSRSTASSPSSSGWWCSVRWCGR